MHEELRRLVDAEWGKVSEQLGDAYRMKAKQVRDDAARHGLIQDAWHPTLNVHLEYAKNRCNERARIWAETIERSKGRFEKPDADFVEREVAPMIGADLGGAERAAHEAGAGAGTSIIIQQMVSLCRGGTIGSLGRELSRRVEDSTLREKEKAREWKAHLSKSLPWSARVILGPEPHHPYLLHVLAWTTYVFFTIGALYGAMQLVSSAKKMWWP